MDWKEIEQQLCDRVEEVCRHLLPNGKRNGAEWCVGNVNGEPGDSLRVNLSGKAGVWCDFAGDDRGNNLMGLWCHVRKQPFKTSIREAKEWLGIRDDHYRRVRSYPDVASNPDRPLSAGGTEPAAGKRVDVKELWPRCAPLTPEGPVWRYLVEGRHLTPEVLEAYGVREMPLWENQWAMVFPYYAPHAREEQSAIERVLAGRANAEGATGNGADGKARERVPSWLKVERLDRPDGKKKEWVTTGPEKCLWGMQASEHAIFRRADHLLIVEGEKDALSWASYGCSNWRVAGSGGILPVSVPFGAKWRPAAVKTASGFEEQRPSPNREWLERCWDWMQGFETIFVGMDMDEAGRKAAADIITEIGPRRCRLVELPEKNLTTDRHG